MLIDSSPTQQNIAHTHIEWKKERKNESRIQENIDKEEKVSIPIFTIPDVCDTWLSWRQTCIMC